MSTDDNTAQAPAAGASPSTSKKPSVLGGLLRLLVPALLAAGAAYGGTRAASAHGPAAHAPELASRHVVPSRPPGPTLPLEPFLVTLFDGAKKTHPMKMAIAVEFDAQTKEDLKTFVPRIRDAVLAYLRTLSHEYVTDPANLEKIRSEIVERCRAAGATTADKVLVTDFVVQ